LVQAREGFYITQAEKVVLNCRGGKESRIGGQVSSREADAGKAKKAVHE